MFTVWEGQQQTVLICTQMREKCSCSKGGSTWSLNRPLSIPGDLPVRTTTQSKQPVSHNKPPKVLYSFIELTKQCFQNQEKYTPMHINTGYSTSEMWFG